MKKKINMTVGRFQPFTLGHLNMIKEGTNNNVPCIIYQIRTKDVPETLNGWKVGSRIVKRSEINNIIKYIEDPNNVLLSKHENDIIKRPFSNELINKELDIVKSNNKNLIYDVVYVSNMFEALIKFNDFIIENNDKFEPGNLICGDDRYESYSNTVNKYDELDSILYNRKVRNYLKNKLNVLYLERNQNGISGTKVREAIIKNDKSTFVSIMPKGVGNAMWFDFKEAFDNFINKLKEMITESNTNNKIFNLVEYINESLSKKNIEKLETYINDENFDTLFKYVRKGYNKSFTTVGEEYKEFFKRHGLSSSFFNEKANLGVKIADIFNEYDAIELFQKIISNNGLIEFDEIKKMTKYNILDIIKNSISNLDLTENISDSTIKSIFTEIFEIDNVKSNNANVGPLEVLLKFILKNNAVSSSHGDVIIQGKNGVEAIEVKSGKTKMTSAHPCGQSVDTNKEVSRYFCKLYGDKQSSTILFGGAKANEKFLQYFDNNIEDIDTFIENIVKSIAYQYKQQDNDNAINIAKNAIINWNNSSKYISNNKIEQITFYSVCVILQTYFYQLSDKWTSLLLVNSNNGHFIIFDMTDFDKQKIEQLLSNIEFYYPEGNDKATGRRSVGRIFIS